MDPIVQQAINRIEAAGLAAVEEYHRANAAEEKRQARLAKRRAAHARRQAAKKLV